MFSRHLYMEASVHYLSVNQATPTLKEQAAYLGGLVLAASTGVGSKTSNISVA